MHSFVSMPFWQSNSPFLLSLSLLPFWEYSGATALVTKDWWLDDEGSELISGAHPFTGLDKLAVMYGYSCWLGRKNTTKQFFFSYFLPSFLIPNLYPFHFPRTSGSAGAANTTHREADGLDALQPDLGFSGSSVAKTIDFLQRPTKKWFILNIRETRLGNCSGNSSFLSPVRPIITHNHHTPQTLNTHHKTHVLINLF